MAGIVTLVDIHDDLVVALWAKNHCPSFTGWVVTEWGPESLYTNYKFYFDNDIDITSFIIRWQGQNESI